MTEIPAQDLTIFRPRSEHSILPTRPLDDRALWNAMRSGDEQALVHIFDLYAKLLFYYGLKITFQEHLVTDAVQELFIALWRQRRRLKDVDSIKAYLFKSLRRKLVRSLSRWQYRLFSTSQSIDHVDEVVPSPEILIIARQVSEERRARLMEMLGTLTRRQREALFLRYFEEMTCGEIAVIMGLSKQAVYNLINKALKQLRSTDGRPEST